MNKTIEELRIEFETLTNRSLSLPIAGTIVWLTAAVGGLFFTARNGVMLLLFGTGAIFPLALLIAKTRGENILAAANPLAKLMGWCVLMVNLLWAVHVVLLLKSAELLPLSVGIGLGLHWVVYSWIVGHPVGLVHAVLRTILVTAAWLSFPEYRVSAVAFAVVAVYAISIYQMSTRTVKTAVQAGS